MFPSKWCHWGSTVIGCLVERMAVVGWLNNEREALSDWSVLPTSCPNIKVVENGCSGQVVLINQVDLLVKSACHSKIQQKWMAPDANLIELNHSTTNKMAVNCKKYIEMERQCAGWTACSDWQSWLWLPQLFLICSNDSRNNIVAHLLLLSYF